MSILVKKNYNGEIIDKKKMNYKIIGKYIKDLSFSIPNSKTFFCYLKKYLSIKLILTLKTIKLKNIVEVTTSLKLIPIDDNFERSMLK